MLSLCKFTLFIKCPLLPFIRSELSKFAFGMKRSRLFWASVSALMPAMLLWACNNDDDVQLSYQHTVQVGLYSMHTHNDTTLSTVQIFGVGREDSLLYDVTTCSDMFLNLNLKRDTTEFVFRTQTLEDDLFFSYTKRLSPVSGSAGIAMEITLDSVGHTSTFIDSVAIVYDKIKYNESRENVQIFVY